MYWILSIILLTSINSTLTAVPTSGCSVVHDGYCHTIVTSNPRINWENARSDCISSGGDLSTITTSTQNNMFMALANSTYNECWIGLNDRYNDAGRDAFSFVWADGSKSAYRSFQLSQPTIYSSRDCVYLFYYNGYWYNYLCLYSFPCYFCERRVPIFGRVTGLSTYTSLNNNAILSSDTTLFCITETGSNQITWSFHNAQYSSTSDVTSRANWDSTNRISTLSVYLSSPGYYSCRVTRNSVWTTYTANIIPAPTAGCSVVYNGYCHTFIASTSAINNWKKSRFACTSRGGDLSTITSSTQNSLFKAFTNSTYRGCWIGLNDRYNDADRDGYNFVWADGSTSTYRSFRPSGGGSEMCVYVYYSNGYWYNNLCSATSNCYFCESAIPVFGKLTISTYTSLNNHAILSSDTTLFCITETGSNQITWSFHNAQSNSTADVTSRANWDSTNRISTLSVYLSSPGYYSCRVTRNSIWSTYTASISQGPTAHCIFVYDGYCHRFIRDSSRKNWENSRSDCISRGGDLSTIISWTQNKLFASSVPSSYSNCWIGLNDINNEAGNDETSFVWADGSTSAYRSFRSGEPSGSSSEDCVFIHYSTAKWYDIRCSYTFSCYFCQEPVSTLFGRVTNGLNYERLDNNAILIFDTLLFCITDTGSSQITWSFQDTQSGSTTDLTSHSNWNSVNRVSTLYVCPKLAGHYSCRVVKGSSYAIYTAITLGAPTVLTLTDDITTTTHTILYPYTNTASVRVLSLNVHLQSNREGRWKNPYNVYINSKSLMFSVFTANDVGLYSFYQYDNCPYSTEVLAMQIQLSATGANLAMQKSGEYIQISNNTIFYTDTTLVCATNTSQRIQWTYRPTQTDTSTTMPSSSNPYTGVSTLNIRTSSSGFYMCNVGSYAAAIFNSEYTIRVKDQMSYDYTKHIDPTNIQIICEPDSLSNSLSNIKWNNQYNNPLILNDQTFSGLRNFECRANTQRILSITLSIQDPKLTIAYPGSTAESFTAISPTVIQIQIPLTSTQVRLSTNFASGTWILPQSTVSASTYSIQEVTLASIGSYSFSTTQTWNGRKSLIFTLDIGITETEIAIRSNAIYQPIQNNTFLENDSEIACFTTYQNAGISSIKWYYQKTVASEPQAENALFNSEIGASSLYVVKYGFYTCHVPNTLGITTSFSIGKFSLTNETESVNDDYFSGYKSKTYIRGQSLVLLYRNPNVTISSVRWTTDAVKNGDTDTGIEFLNPVDVSDVFSRMGSGAYTFSCFYRQSPITVVGNIQMDLKDTAYIQLSYGTTVREFGDLNNENFPFPQSINIQILTQKIKLNCDLNKCDLEINGKQEFSTSGGEYNIEVLKIEDQGLYALRRYTDDDFSYLTANFILNVTGFVEQKIHSLKHRDLNDSSIILFWEIETVLPEKAEQMFRISYNGTKETFTKFTTETCYNLTDLIPGKTYMIYVTLSYAYTLETSNLSVTITLPEIPVTAATAASASASTPAPMVYIIPSVVVAIVIVILVCILLITVISCKIKKRKGQKIEKEHDTTDIVKVKITSTNTKKSKGKKANITKYSNIKEIDTDIPLEDLRKPAHFYSSIEECAAYLPKGLKPTYYSNLSEFPTTNFDQPPSSEYKANDHTLSESTEREYMQTPYFNQGTLSPNKHPEDVPIASYQQFEVSGAENIYYAPTKALEMWKFHDEPKSTNIPDNQFRETYQKYMKTGTEETSNMEEEYDKLTLNTQKAFHEEIIEAIKPENDIKNPIQDILPFEDNRVVLESPYLEGDYINASHVCNYQLIAAMHPTTETLADFLQMLYQTEPSMVVMLATKEEKAKMIGDLSERKAYWPKEGMNLDCHPFSVSIVGKVEDDASIIKQELLIKHEVEKKNIAVLQCISTVWNDDGTPSNLNNVIVLLGQIIHQKETEPLKPIIIHCDDGIAKTGILLTIFNVVQELKLKKSVNIYNAVRKLRKQRMQMVPILACYKACYALMNEYCSIHL